MRIRHVLAAVTCATAALAGVLTTQSTADARDDTISRTPAPSNTTWRAPDGSNVHATGATAPKPDNTTWVAPTNGD